MTEGLWATLKSVDKTWDHKAEAIAGFAISTISLRFPSDETMKTLIAILVLCHDIELMPFDAYDEVRKVT